MPQPEKKSEITESGFKKKIALKEFCLNVNLCKVHSFYSKNITFSKNEFTKKIRELPYRKQVQGLHLGKKS